MMTDDAATFKIIAVDEPPPGSDQLYYVENLRIGLRAFCRARSEAQVRDELAIVVARFDHRE